MDIKETIDYCISTAVKIGFDTYSKTLDFTDESIQDVDEILDIYHDRYLHSEKDDALIKEHITAFAQIFGIYVGEVLIRRHSDAYTWKDTEFGIVLAKNADNFINPIAKAGKQIMYGKECGDDIKSFFNVAVSIIEGKFKM